MHVIFMRDEKSNEDFVRYFKARNCTVDCVPVLEITLDTDAFARWFPCGDNMLDQIIERYSGLVFTSKNAALVFNKIVTVDENHESPSVPCFVVGEGTASALGKHKFFDFQGLLGDAKSLSIEIVRRFADKRHDMKPLLYLTGSKRRDIISNAFVEARIPFDEVVVYHNMPVSENSIRESLNGISITEKRSYIVFFSPSGVDSSFNAVKKLLDDKSNDYKIVCIGPVTGDHVERVFHVHDPLVSSKPTPEGLYETIGSYDQIY